MCIFALTSMDGAYTSIYAIAPIRLIKKPIVYAITNDNTSRNQNALCHKLKLEF